MKRRIAVVTGTRAEYGLLKNIIWGISQDEELELILIATGTHLSEQYGYSIQEIEQDGFIIDEKILNLMDSSSREAIAKSMGIIMLSISQSFERLKPDIVLILGDRYEIFAVASVAMCMNIPIAHISGGESTEGAIDEQIRHAITKMAHLHFATTENYRNNIIKMGEESWRVFNFGHPSVENVQKQKLLDDDELFNALKIENKAEKLFLVTYHPVTLELNSLESQVDNLICALERFGATIIFTYPNADAGSEIIIKKIIEFQNSNKNIKLFKNLGLVKYLSLLKYADVMIGNSSSGITEAPIFKLPVVNIGNRQSGRIKCENVIDVGYEADEIIAGIEKAINDKKFENNLSKMVNIFGDGNTSQNIVKTLKQIKIDNKLLFKKLIF